MYFVRDAGPRSLLTEQIYRGRVSVVVVVAFSKGGGEEEVWRVLMEMHARMQIRN